MSRGTKIGLVAFLSAAGLAALVLGIVTQLYSLSLSIVFSITIWIVAILVYVLVGERKPGRNTIKTITDSGCREATTRRSR